MANLAALIKTNAARWTAMHITASRSAAVQKVAERLVAAKVRYIPIAAKTGVPWFVIAVIHEREASQNFACSIAQGDPWGKVSIHVPKGRGPFPSFDVAAEDALIECAPYAAHWKDWSTGGALTLLEQYNGLGYADGPFDRYTGVHYPPQPSPYIWAATDQYHVGKYTADGSFNPSVEDQQLGCAALIAGMKLLDRTIQFGPQASPIATPTASKPAPTPPLIQAIAAFIAGLFRKH